MKGISKTENHSAGSTRFYSHTPCQPLFPLPPFLTHPQLVFGLLVLYPFAIPYMFLYMLKQRKKRLGGGGKRGKEGGAAAAGAAVPAGGSKKSRKAE